MPADWQTLAEQATQALKECQKSRAASAELAAELHRIISDYHNRVVKLMEIVDLLLEEKALLSEGLSLEDTFDLRHPEALLEEYE